MRALIVFESMFGNTQLLDGEAEQALIWGERLAATVAGVPRS
jgi:hypothetical protein